MLIIEITILTILTGIFITTAVIARNSYKNDRLYKSAIDAVLSKHTNINLTIPAGKVQIDKRKASIDIRDKNRFTVERTEKENEFTFYIVLDKGLDERYIFIHHSKGQFFGLGHVYEA